MKLIKRDDTVLLTKPKKKRYTPRTERHWKLNKGKLSTACTSANMHKHRACSVLTCPCICHTKYDG